MNIYQMVYHVLYTASYKLSNVYGTGVIRFPIGVVVSTDQYDVNDGDTEKNISTCNLIFACCHLVICLLFFVGMSLPIFGSFHVVLNQAK